MTILAVGNTRTRISHHFNELLTTKLSPRWRKYNLVECGRAFHIDLGNRERTMRYLHTMIRVSNVEQSLDFFCNKLGMVEVRRIDNEAGRFTLIFLAANDDKDAGVRTRAPLVELTYNWDPEEYSGGRNFGHLAYEVDNIYDTCQSLMDNGVTINRPPRDGYMAFIKTPDNISIELLQKGEPLAKAEPWASMKNIGNW